MVLIRGGEKKNIKVTPEKRPERPGRPQEMPIPDPTDREKIEEWIKKMKPGEMDNNQMKFRLIHPPVMQRALPPIPGNMSVSITKSGKEPANIVVKRGEDKCEVTEDNLDKLPPDVRPHIEKMLGGVRIQIGGFNEQGLKINPNIRMFQHRIKPGEKDGNIDINKRMVELEKKLERLQRSIDEMMRKNRPDRG